MSSAASWSPLAALAVTASLLLGGCGSEFDSGSELKALRVLAVQKSAPYAEAGNKVDFNLYWHDAAQEAPRPIERAWIGGCINPPGDLYYGCFAQLGRALAAGADEDGVEGVTFAVGDTPDYDKFQLTLPEDIVSGRGGVEPGQNPYGLAVVFFAVCAGHIGLSPPARGSAAFPLTCTSDDGVTLGADDFVAGYSYVYSFPGVENANPEIGGFEVRGQALDLDPDFDCIGEACMTPPPSETPAIDCEGEQAVRCVRACKDDGDDSCPDIHLKPSIDPATFEVDEATSQLEGGRVNEQMWVNYYVDRGEITEVRLLNDSTTGFNDEYRADLHAPREPGPMHVWAVAHDNRGGMQIARVTLNVEP